MFFSTSFIMAGLLYQIKIVQLFDLHTKVKHNQKYEGETKMRLVHWFQRLKYEDLMVFLSHIRSKLTVFWFLKCYEPLFIKTIKKITSVIPLNEYNYHPSWEYVTHDNTTYCIKSYLRVFPDVLLPVIDTTTMVCV